MTEKKQKVYVLTLLDRDWSYDVVGVFKTRKRAQKEAEKFDLSGVTPWIDECTINSPNVFELWGNHYYKQGTR